MEQPLTPAFRQIVLDLEEEMKDISTAFDGTNLFTVASSEELRSIHTAATEYLASFSWPRNFLASEAARIFTRIANINRKIGKIVETSSQGNIEILVRAVPAALRNIVVRFTGRLPRSTFCSICRGVFSGLQCKRPSIIDHPACVCRGRQVYGKRCIDRALRVSSFCPACSHNLSDNPVMTTQIRTRVCRLRRPILEAFLAEKRLLRLRHEEIQKEIEGIEQHTDVHVLQEIAIEEAEAVLNEIVDAAVSDNVHSREYYKTLVSLAKHSKSVQAAWRTDRMDIATIHLQSLRDICEATLESIAEDKKSVSARARLQDLLDNIDEFSPIEDTNPNGVELLPRSKAYNDTEYWMFLDAEMKPADRPVGFADDFHHTHVLALGELCDRAHLVIFESLDIPDWKPQDALFEGLSFVYGINFILETMALTPEIVDILQKWSEETLLHLAWLSVDLDLEIDNLVDLDNGRLKKNFEDTYYGVQLNVVLEHERRTAIHSLAASSGPEEHTEP